jgi:arginine exporter protein ArgO
VPECWDEYGSLGLELHFGRQCWYMTLHFMLKGLAIGFSIAAPVGPIGVLCIRRSLAEGRLIGSALWWLLLSNGVALFQARVSSGWMHAINRVSGGVIFVFGLYSLSIVFFK